MIWSQRSALRCASYGAAILPERRPVSALTRIAIDPRQREAERCIGWRVIQKHLTLKHLIQQYLIQKNLIQTHRVYHRFEPLLAIARITATLQS